MKIISKSLFWKIPLMYPLIVGIIYLLDVRLFGGNEDCFWREFFWEKAVVLFFCSVFGVLVSEYLTLKKSKKSKTEVV